LQQFGISSNHRVLDPFCGTGTTLVECKKLGIPSMGVEANPAAGFASQVKVDWHPETEGFIEQSQEIAAAAQAQLLHEGKTLRTLPDDTSKLLLKNSISPLPLHKTLVLLDCLQQYEHGQYYKHQRLALAKALTGTISNLHFGPEVGVGPVKPDAPVIAAWLANIQAMADDLRQLKCKTAPAFVQQADSRQLLAVLEPESIDAVITSPPYPNEKDYTRTTRLELVLLGFIQNKFELQALKRGMVRSNTRGVYKQDDDDEWTVAYPAVQQLAAAIEARRLALAKTSGFERLYARVTKLYFGGMARHLADLRTILRPGAQLAYVVGDQASYLQILIRTGQLLAEIAQSLGYQLVSIDLFRTRVATATKTQLREEVVVLRWPG